MNTLTLMGRQIAGDRLEGPIKEPCAGKTLSEVAPIVGAEEAALAWIDNVRQVPAERWGDVTLRDRQSVVFVMTPGVDTGNSIGNWITGHTQLMKLAKLTQPKTPKQNNELANRQAGTPEAGGTFGFGKLTNTQGTGGVVAVGLGGPFRAAPRLIQSYLRSENRTEVLHEILLLGEGPWKSVGGFTSDQTDVARNDIPLDIRFNDRWAGNFDTKISVRLGNDPQDPVPQAATVVQSYNYDHKLEKSHNSASLRRSANPNDNAYAYTDRLSYFEHPVRAVAPDEIWAHLAFPRGLYRFSGSHENPTEISVWFRMDLRTANTDTDTQGTLLYALPVRCFADRTSHVSFTFHIGGIQELLEANALPRGTALKLEIYRNSPNIPFQDKLQDHVDECYVKQIQEAHWDRLMYQNSVLLSHSTTANSEINSGRPSITTICEGSKVYNSDDDVTEQTATPAWNLREIATNTRWGMGARWAGAVHETSAAEFADFCDEAVPLYTGSAEEAEARFRMALLIEERQRGWALLKRLGRLFRCIPTPSAGKLRFIVLDAVDTPHHEFGEAIASEASTKIAWNDKSASRTRVEIKFRDEAKDHELITKPFTWPAAEAADEPTEAMQIDAVGVPSFHQALRMAYHELAHEQLPELAIEFSMPFEAILVTPGDVFNFPIEKIQGTHTGRVLDADGSSITLSEEIAFEAGIIYQYRERHHDGTVSTVDFKASTTTDTLPFQTPHSDGADAIGRFYIVVVKDVSMRTFRCLGISGVDSSFRRTITAIEYVAAAETDDGLTPDGGVFVPSTTPPPAVTNLAAVESFNAPGSSTIDVTWTDAAGATIYFVWAKWTTTVTGDEYQLLGTSPGSSFSFDTDLPFGAYLTVLVQSATSGARDSFDDSATATLQILRDDVGETVAVFPDQVTNFAATLVSGNDYTLSWDAVSTPSADSYEVRRGGWGDGVVVGVTAGLSMGVKVGNVGETFFIRAKKGNFYSSRVATVDVSATQFGSFSGSVASLDDDQTDGFVSSGSLNNGNVIVQELNDGTWRMYQNTQGPEEFLEYRSPVYTSGISEPLHISLSLNVAALVRNRPSELIAHKNISRYGLINGSYLTTRVYLEYSTGTSFPDDPHKFVEITDSQNDIINLTARHVRLLVHSSVTDIESTDGLALRPSIERLRFAVHRNP